MCIPTFKTQLIKPNGYEGRFVDSGAKHFVTNSTINNTNELYNIAQKIRYHETFHPSGTNVNFLRIKHSNKISVITYEKGIEKIMLSCGSGAVAIFYSLFTKNIVRMGVAVSIALPTPLYYRYGA